MPACTAQDRAGRIFGEELFYQYRRPEGRSSAGAVQDYGAAIDLTAGKSQTPFWHSEALLDASHRLTALTDNPFTDPDGVSIKQGDGSKLGVTYNNTSNEWLNSATAGAMVYVRSPDEGIEALSSRGSTAGSRCHR